MKPSILIINGPVFADQDDCDSDGSRGLTLSMVRKAAAALCAEFGIQLDFRQTDDENQCLQWIAGESGNFDGIVVNPGGFPRPMTVSEANYRAASQAVAQHGTTVIEVRLNNLYRESAEVTRSVHEPEWCSGLVCGFGLNGYLAAIRAVKFQLEGRD